MEYINDFFNKYWNGDYPELELFLTNGFQILLILLLTWFVMRWRLKVIKRSLRITKLEGKREDTLASLLLSLSKYVIIGIAALMILQRLGVKTTPILASAGVVGLAVGFGAQNLIKDFISGFFIMFEDWMNVGDYVQIGEVKGTVEQIGLRSTIIREWSGKQVHLLNSSITKLVNYNREQMRPIVSFNIPYEYPSDEVANVIEKACKQINTIHADHLLKDQLGKVIEPIQLYGITDVENNALGAKYAIVGLVKDDSYWLMAKEIRKITLEFLNENGIHVAYPRRIYANDPNYEEESN